VKRPKPVTIVVRHDAQRKDANKCLQAAVQRRPQKSVRSLVLLDREKTRVERRRKEGREMKKVGKRRQKPELTAKQQLPMKDWSLNEAITPRCSVPG
jgi:hypothetical protein